MWVGRTVLEVGGGRGAGGGGAWCSARSFSWSDGVRE